MGTAERKVTLKTADGVAVDVGEDVVMECERLRPCFKDVSKENLKHDAPDFVTGPSLKKAVEYTKKIMELRSRRGGTGNIEAFFEREFTRKDGINFHELLLVTAYLKSHHLHHVVITILVRKMKAMTLEQIRDYFGVVNDFTPEEERQIRQEIQWAYE